MGYLYGARGLGTFVLKEGGERTVPSLTNNKDKMGPWELWGPWEPLKELIEEPWGPIEEP
jgi:hypothetical protein